MGVKYYDGRLDTEMNRWNVQRCINWTKKHKRGKRLLRQPRSMWDFLVRILLHLSKIVFSYLIHFFISLLEDKGAINYLYVSMENIPDRIGGRALFNGLFSH